MDYTLSAGNYPVHIDDLYRNRLDLEGFSYMMKDPSYCYKFYGILKKNMQPLYDSARRQGYEIWNRGEGRI